MFWTVWKVNSTRKEEHNQMWLTSINVNGIGILQKYRKQNEEWRWINPSSFCFGHGLLDCVCHACVVSSMHQHSSSGALWMKVFPVVCLSWLSLSCRVASSLPPNRLHAKEWEPKVSCQFCSAACPRRPASCTTTCKTSLALPAMSRTRLLQPTTLVMVSLIVSVMTAW